MASRLVPRQPDAETAATDCDAPDADPELPEVPEPIATADGGYGYTV